MERKATRRHKYIPNSTNLFEDNSDEGNFDVTEPTSSFRPRFPPLKPNEDRIEELGRQRQIILDKKREIEQRTLDSSSRGLGLLYDSEKTGTTAAEELIRQREILEKTNNKLDETHPNLDKSQKHLKSINSIYYSIKKYISGKSDEQPKRRKTQSLRRFKPKNTTLDIAMENMSRRSVTECNYMSHPSTLLRDHENPVEVKPVSSSFDVELTENLNEMSHVIARLKNLGTALGEELNSQNQLLETISDNMERADMKIDYQNKQMNKILGK